MLNYPVNGTLRWYQRLISLLLVLLTSTQLVMAEAAPAPSSGDSSAATGIVFGRVLNSATGQYLNNAIVSVKGSKLAALTDESGTFRLTNVPLGLAILEVSFTGMESKQIPVTVGGGGPVEQNIELGGASNRSDYGEVVKLGEFVVASQAMEGSAIALQEQRVAPNIKKVVAADEFGLVPDGNIGEFLKLMPGIAMSSRGGDPREISINGAPSTSVPVTVDGFGLASSEMSGTGRNVELNNTSINTLSRIEAILSVTPDTPAAALAGTINLVPRSAFERARPEFQGTLYLNWRDTTAELRTKGPRRNPTYKMLPGFELSWVVPVNKRFGFTVSAGASVQYFENSTAQRTTRGSQSATNGIGFPHTTLDQPYLSDYLVGVQSKTAQRSSLGLTADYRLRPGSTLSFGFQFGTLYTDFSQRNLTFSAVLNGANAGNRPQAFNAGLTHGGIGKGQLQSQTSANNRYTQTWMPTLRYRLKGAVWAADAGIGYSQAQNIFRNVHRGIMQTTNSIRNNVTVNFDDVDKNYIAPVITVTDGATGAVIDPYNISSYVVQNANGNEQTKESAITTAFGSVERQFEARWPMSAKVGFQLDRSMNDNRSYSTGPLNYLGADHAASTAPTATSDDGSAQFYDPNFRQHVYLFGAPRIQWVDNQSVYENYIAHPDYWTTNAATKARNELNASKFSDEIVSATYFRGDIDLFDRRLHLNGGVRAEQTNVKAAGPLNDPQRGLVARGYKVKKEYFRLFPSINTRYSIREDLLFRLSYYQSIGRPDFSQYSGGLTLPDTQLAPSANNRLVINNAAIKAWTADTVKATLEYYLPRLGNISVSGFRRDYTNFFGSSTTVATREFLDLYGLDFDTYKNYDVATQTNLPNVLHTEGMDIDYKQALTFLPHWARGVQVFANVSWLHFRNYDFNSGTDLAISNFGFFVPRIFNYGISLTRSKFNVRLNANIMAKHRQNSVSGNGIEPGTYAWKTARRFFDVSGEYALTHHVRLFGSIRNIGDEPEDVEVYGPHTPVNTRFRGRNNFYALVTVGLKGKF